MDEISSPVKRVSGTRPTHPTLRDAAGPSQTTVGSTISKNRAASSVAAGVVGRVQRTDPLLRRHRGPRRGQQLDRDARVVPQDLQPLGAQPQGQGQRILGRLVVGAVRPTRQELLVAGRQRVEVEGLARHLGQVGDRRRPDLEDMDVGIDAELSTNAPTSSGGDGAIQTPLYSVPKPAELRRERRPCRLRCQDFGQREGQHGPVGVRVLVHRAHVPDPSAPVREDVATTARHREVRPPAATVSFEQAPLDHARQGLPASRPR